MYVSVYGICTYVSMKVWVGAQRCQKKVLDLLELELEIIVKCHVSAGRELQ